MQATEPPPIACTLNATEMAPRLARLAALARDHLRSHTLNGATVHLVYDRAAADEVANVVDLERQCCGSMDFELSETGDAVMLTISAPESSAGGAAWLFSQFLPAMQFAETPTSAPCQCCNS